MEKNRLEAFSDGVMAIIITIMVLEIKVPESDSWEAIKELFPKLISYALSFIYAGIYWNNHHHMFHMVKKVNGKILWANLNLLFWLSLTPFATGWVGEHNFSTHPVMLYGFVLLMSAIAYYILYLQIIKTEGDNSQLEKAIGKDSKGKISQILYISGIITGYFFPLIGFSFYILVAIMWLVPDKRIEKFYN